MQIRLYRSRPYWCVHVLHCVVSLSQCVFATPNSLRGFTSIHFEHILPSCPSSIVTCLYDGLFFRFGLWCSLRHSAIIAFLHSLHVASMPSHALQFLWKSVNGTNLPQCPHLFTSTPSTTMWIFFLTPILHRLKGTQVAGSPLKDLCATVIIYYPCKIKS